MRRIVSMLLAFAMVVGLIPVYISAAESVEVATAEVEEVWEIISEDILQKDAPFDVVYSEAESNNNRAYANIVESDYTVYGDVYSKDFVDWYVFDVPERSKVTIIALPEYDSFSLGIVNSSGNYILNDLDGTYQDGILVYQIECILGSGTYYFTAEDNSSNKTNEYYVYIAIDKIVCSHSWDEGTVIKEPTEDTEGEKTYTCKDCKKTKVEPIPKTEHVHSFDSDWKSDSEEHWKVCSCGEFGEKEIHSSANTACGAEAVCNICGAGYTVNPEHDMVLGGNGAFHVWGCKKCSLRENLGLHVDENGDTVCDNCGSIVTDMPKGTQGDALWFLDGGVLYLFDGGTTGDLESPGDYAWYPYRDQIESVYAFGISIGIHAFQGYSSLKILAIMGANYSEETVRSIGAQAFADCENLYAIEIKDGTPQIAEDAFYNVDARVNCYANWPVNLCKDYGGSLEWYIDKVSVQQPHTHTYGDWVVRREATCEQDGEQYRECSCGETETEVIPATEHSFRNGKCDYCGEKNPTYTKPVEGVTRLAGDSRYETSFAIANEMKIILGVDKFEAIILASSDSFADALAGSYLAAVKNAPVIIAKQKYASLVCEYLNENLAEYGTIYILGGTTAMPSSILAEITVDYKPVRLAGADRYATNLAILEKAGIGSKDILIATGRDFSDCLSASATGLPILLVDGKPGKHLTQGQKDFLATVKGDIYIIGGNSTIPAELREEIEAASGKSTQRIAGDSRYETSVKIAEKFLRNAESAVLAYAGDYPDGLCGGPLAYLKGAPLILTKNGKAEAPAYLAEKNITTGYVLGGSSLISDEAVGEIF